MTIREKKRYGEHHPVKIGTGPREMVWVRFPEGGAETGDWIEYRRELYGPWQEARIWRILPPPDYMLFLEC